MNLYLILGAGIVVAAMTGGAYFKGHSKGVAKDKARSDLVMSGMVIRAAEDLASANATNAATTTQLQATKEKAENERQVERTRSASRIAAAVATDRLVRDQLADFARGAGGSQNTVAACRSDASVLGDVFGDALRAHGVCVEAAEQEAGNARLLLNAWPTVNHEGKVK